MDFGRLILLLFFRVYNDGVEETKKTTEEDYPASKMRMVTEDVVPKKDSEDNINREDAEEEKDGKYEQKVEIYYQ